MATWTSSNRQEEERLLKIYRDLSTRDKLRIRGYAEAIASVPASKPAKTMGLRDFLGGLFGGASWAR
jgi:hypothetical protein